MLHKEINEGLGGEQERSNLVHVEWTELLSPVRRSSAGNPSWLPSVSIVMDETPTFVATVPEQHAAHNAPLNTKESPRNSDGMLWQKPAPSADPSSRNDSLPQLSIDERDSFLEKLCAAANACPKPDLAVSSLVQEVTSMGGFGAVLNALTIYANLHE